MDGGISLGRVLGIRVFLHPTWFVVFFLITVTLSSALGREHGEWSSATRLVLAGATSVLFFFSIFLHELGHSILALRHRVAVRSITLFIFGGVAMMEREPETPRAEFEIAIAGPVVSALLALAFTLLGQGLHPDSAVASMASWLAFINLAIAIFNLLPGFPLDGGRVLRAFLWARSNDFRKATRTAASVGSFIAYGFIGLGVAEVLFLGNLVGGLWTAFIGWFLLSASGSTARQVAMEASLAGLRARDVMNPDVARVHAGVSVASFARDVVMHGRRWALVEEAGRTAGIVTLSDIKRVTPDEWESTPVGRVATPMDKVVTAVPDAPLRELLATISQKDLNQVPVLVDERVVGAVTRDALVQAIDLRGGLR